MIGSTLNYIPGTITEQITLLNCLRDENKISETEYNYKISEYVSFFEPQKEEYEKWKKLKL